MDMKSLPNDYTINSVLVHHRSTNICKGYQCCEPCLWQTRITFFSSVKALCLSHLIFLPSSRSRSCCVKSSHPWLSTVKNSSSYSEVKVAQKKNNSTTRKERLHSILGEANNDQCKTHLLTKVESTMTLSREL